MSAIVPVPVIVVAPGRIMSIEIFRMHQSEVTPSSPTSREGSYDPYLTDNTGLAEAVFLIGGNQPVIMISP